MTTTTTFLSLAPAQAFAGFRKTAVQFECPVSEGDKTLEITLEVARIFLSAEGEGTKLLLEASNDGNLQMMRDVLSEQLKGYGVIPDWQGAKPAARPANQTLVTIDKVDRLSPSYMRVTMSGDQLARFGTGGFHFRLLFGPEGAGWPFVDEHGVTQWPGGTAAWHKPVYTTRSIEIDGEAARIEFDVFRHEGGTVTEWCDQVRPGTEMVIMGPGGSGKVNRAGWQGFIGDETAVPVIKRFLELLPEDTRGEAVLFVPERGDIQDLARPAGVSLRWVMREDGETPLQALDKLPIPDADRYVFFAAEKVEALAARAALLERGLDKSESIAATYWIAEKELAEA
ncbi:siderophore-interacting protein [Celeribacter sp.]|uniref:siderophore-interacting protein n=1 Tax=Celeribacter sp. TaxID=1890673 RepID=UPI003A927646